jgi:hypothetical protein
MFRVFEGATGKKLYEFDAGKVVKGRLWHSSHGVTIADLTGDGRLDVFFVVGGTQPEKHGHAMCLTGFPGKGRGWYMLRHDPENTGNASTPLPKTLLAHIEGLTPKRKAVMKPARPPKFGSSTPGRKPAARGPVARGRVDKTAVHALAIQRGIDPEALGAVFAAAELRPEPGAREKAIAFGAPAFHAACLLIETGWGITHLDAILEATWKPGLEKHLLALAKGPKLPGWGRSAALRNLSVADTKEVREYLLRRIVTERDASDFYSTALALGKLAESRATPVIVRQLLAFETGWQGVEPYLVIALAGTGGKDANEWLVQYLADERARSGLSAVMQISKTDRELAKREAKKLLESGRKLSENGRKMLERLAK